MNINDVIKTTEYGFLRENKRIADHTMFLVIGGSYAYGLNIEGSDIDVRGILENTKEELLGMASFEQFTDKQTDSVLFGFRKLTQLLNSSNPNVMELFGGRPEDYANVSDAGRLLLDNYQIFTSKRCINHYIGAAKQQLARGNTPTVQAYFTDTTNEELIKQGLKIKSKYMMHALRYYYALIELLETGEVHNYREKEHDLLMDVRMGKYILPNGNPTSDYFEILFYLEDKCQKTAQLSVLPSDPDMNRVQDFVIQINEMTLAK